MDCKNNGEENKFSAFPRNEKVPAKKEYFEKINVKQNQTSQSLTLHQIHCNHSTSSKLTRPLFDNYVDVGNGG